MTIVFAQKVVSRVKNSSSLTRKVRLRLKIEFYWWRSLDKRGLLFDHWRVQGSLLSQFSFMIRVSKVSLKHVVSRIKLAFSLRKLEILQRFRLIPYCWEVIFVWRFFYGVLLRRFQGSIRKWGCSETFLVCSCVFVCIGKLNFYY